MFPGVRCDVVVSVSDCGHKNIRKSRWSGPAPQLMMSSWLSSVHLWHSSLPSLLSPLSPLSPLSNLHDTQHSGLSHHNWHQLVTPSPLLSSPQLRDSPIIHAPSQPRRLSDAMNWISNLIVVGPFSVEVQAINCVRAWAVNNGYTGACHWPR